MGCDATEGVLWGSQDLCVAPQQDTAALVLEHRELTCIQQCVPAWMHWRPQPHPPPHDPRLAMAHIMHALQCLCPVRLAASKSLCMLTKLEAEHAAGTQWTVLMRSACWPTPLWPRTGSSRSWAPSLCPPSPWGLLLRLTTPRQR